MSSMKPLYHKVSGRSLKPRNALRKPIQPTRFMKGPREAKTSNSSKKAKVCFDEKILKRRCKENPCSLCKQHGGTNMTNDTAECKKYDSNNTPRKTSMEGCTWKVLWTQETYQGRSSYIHTYLLKLRN